MFDCSIFFVLQMSHLFNMFVKQVADYCDTSSMPGKLFFPLAHVYTIFTVNTAGFIIIMYRTRTYAGVTE